MNIVLAHGILDLSQLVFKLPFAATPQYFRGIYQLLKNRHHTVIEPKVAILGSLEQRSQELAEQIESQMPAGELHVIAHSMGGLDMRHILKRSDKLAQGIAARTRSLICIGTPHFGAPLADRTAFGTGPLGALFPSRLGAPKDLVTCAQLQDLDADHVDHFDIACDAALAPYSFLFATCAAASGFASGVIHDGVVDEPSARAQHPPPRPSPHHQLPTWPTDHGGAIGWERLPLGALQALLGAVPTAHLARYAALAQMLEQRYGA